MASDVARALKVLSAAKKQKRTGIRINKDMPPELRN